VSNRLNWERDGRDWPNRAFSRFVVADGLRWHVQVMGEGPVVLLVHGTGASTHSFRQLGPLLAPNYTVVIPDLPGHGFSKAPSSPAGYSLPKVARGLAALLEVLNLSPVLVVGHSAGAAVVVRMTLNGLVDPVAVISLNGALLPFPGVAYNFFGPTARLLASSSLAAKAFSLLAGSHPSVERMLRSTGSRIDPEGKRLYTRLAGNPGHVQAALALMANWDLRPLARDLPDVSSRLILVTGSQDGMVPPAESYRVLKLVPKAELVSLRGLGHLAHEERPDEIAALLRRTMPHDASG
jgi:magnesium chelatase accessory protein